MSRPRASKAVDLGGLSTTTTLSITATTVKAFVLINNSIVLTPQGNVSLQETETVTGPQASNMHRCRDQS